LLDLKADLTKLCAWLVGTYTGATGSDYLDEQALSKILSRATEMLSTRAAIDAESGLRTLLEQGYIAKIPSSTTLYTTAKGKTTIRELKPETIGLDQHELEQVRDAVLVEIANRISKVKVPEIVAGMKCQVCGRRSDNPLTRKTCCVNKLYVFCSEACLQRWNRDWLRRQEQISTKAKPAVV